MKRKLRTMFSLPAYEWRLTLHAWWLLLLADLGLRALPFQRLHTWFTSLKTVSTGTPAEIDHAIHCSKYAVLRAAGYHLIPMTCLRRSLTLQRLLACQGIPSRLRFGVLRQNGDLQAHAWVEYAGRPISEAQTIEERYAPLAFRE